MAVVVTAVLLGDGRLGYRCQKDNYAVTAREDGMLVPHSGLDITSYPPDLQTVATAMSWFLKEDRGYNGSHNTVKMKDWLRRGGR